MPDRMHRLRRDSKDPEPSRDFFPADRLSLRNPTVSMKDFVPPRADKQ